MKKIAMLLIAMTMAFAAQAQQYHFSKENYSFKGPFHADKWYVGASLTGLDLNYSGLNDLTFGAQAKAGYFICDNWLLGGQAEYDTNGKAADSLVLGLMLRYYIEQNGLYLGLNANYLHANKNYNDFMPGVEIGYSYFINRVVAIEPAIYYNQSFKCHSDYSNFGFKIGLGIYLND